MRDHDPCTSGKGRPKRRWATLAAAEFVVHYQIIVHGCAQRVYHCPKCEGWHTSRLHGAEASRIVHDIRAISDNSKTQD